MQARVTVTEDFLCVEHISDTIFFNESVTPELVSSPQSVNGSAGVPAEVLMPSKLGTCVSQKGGRGGGGRRTKGH